MTRNLLCEIGVEELPVSYLTSALKQLPGLLSDALKDARLHHEAIEVLGTPRRLTAIVSGLSAQQPDVDEWVNGPPKRVGVDAAGEFTRAALVFAKKQGQDASGLKVVTTDKGDYVAVRRQETGHKAEDVLPNLLTGVFSRISFRKPMRWSNVGVPFGRPIQWLLVLLDNEVVDLTFAGVRSGRTTLGHRFLAPEAITIESPSTYVDQLRKARVLVDLDERRARTETLLKEAADEIGGIMVEDAFLLEECASLVEEPFVIPGSFEPEYLELPDSVIVGVMRDHQRYLAVRDPEGDALLPRYLNVANTGEDPKTIALGNDRVLRARLKDAQFFVTEDKKRKLEDRVADLDKVTFQHKLGSIGDKVRRLGVFLKSNAAQAGGADEVAEAAAQLAKADLVTLIVYEFGELQGEMGRYYAQCEGLRPEVALAIEEHYQPKGKADSPPTSVPGAWVSVADKLDTLVGCFGVGIEPTGSADPFGLRRAALGVIRTAIEGPIDVKLRPLLGACRKAFVSPEAIGDQLKDASELSEQLIEFFTHRLIHHYRDAHRGDVVKAVVSAWREHQGEELSVRDLNERMTALSAFVEHERFDALGVAFKRAHNITKEHSPGVVEEALLEAGAERTLFDAFESAKATIEKNAIDGDYGKALEAIAEGLGAPIDAYFEEVFVMAEDERIRTNRLNLLAGIAGSVAQIANFHELST